MVPVDRLSADVNRNPARQVRGLRIGARVGLQQHRLLVKVADADTDDRQAIAVMIVTELSELLARDEERGLPVREALLGVWQLQRRRAYTVQSRAHRLTNSLRSFGYSSCSAAS